MSESRVADFRSDTLTQPTPAMREAMARADVGDDVFGEDPTIAELEREGAAFLGKEAALYVPSGTMANQIAIHVHCRPGDELVCEERSHVFVYEGGSVARLSGTQVRTLQAASGFPEPADVKAAVRADDPHYPRSRLFVMENTHNMAGGRVSDAARADALFDVAHAAGMQTHVDGARLANAAVALDVPAARLVQGADSVSLCLSKGLGAPVGSLLASSAAFIHEARRTRKAFGGGMRQAGVLAAAGLLALREGPAHLTVDHDRARRLADACRDLAAVQVVPPDTNILMVDFADGRSDAFVAHLAEHRVAVLKAGPDRVRFVTHRDQNDGDIERALGAIAAWS